MDRRDFIRAASCSALVPLAVLGASGASGLRLKPGEEAPVVDGMSIRNVGEHDLILNLPECDLPTFRPNPERILQPGIGDLVMRDGKSYRVISINRSARN